MIIYNITIKVAATIANDWLTWMKTEHIPDYMRTGLFTDYRLCRLLEQDETEGPTYIVQYFAAHIEHYNAYLLEYAQLMRDKGYKKFGDRFIAFRTIMEVEP